MPTVTSENKAEFDREFMERKNPPKREHISKQLPEVQGSEVHQHHKEREYRYASQAMSEIKRGATSGGGWKEGQTRYYDENMQTPPKDPKKWAHIVTPLEHKEHGMKHIVLSQNKRGYSVHHYHKPHKK
jgi:hypothetical protein